MDQVGRYKRRAPTGRLHAHQRGVKRRLGCLSLLHEAPILAQTAAHRAGAKGGRTPDDHPSKARCLSELSVLYRSVGNYVKHEQLLTHALKLEKGRGNDDQIAHTLRRLADANSVPGLFEEGIRQAKEALKIYERLGDPEGQASCLNCLVWLSCADGQHGGAEEAASRVINPHLPLGRNRGFWVRDSHYALGHISFQGGEGEGHLSLRGGSRSRIPFSSAPSAVLDSLLTGETLS